MNELDQAPGLILAVISVLLLLGAAVAAVAEAAFDRLSLAGAQDLVEQGKPRAELVQRLVIRRRRTLFSLRFVRVMLQTLATVAITLVTANLQVSWWAILIIAVAVATLAVLALVAVIPVQIGRRWPEAMALALAGLTNAVVALAALGYPFLRLVRARARAQTQTDAQARHEITEDLRELVDDLGEAESLDIEEEDRQMLRSVFELGTTLVREVMIPRTKMATLSLDCDLRQAIGELVDSGFSRMPVVGQDVDDIRGIVYLKDAIARWFRNPEAIDRPVHLVMREAAFVPETKLADDLLRQMQSDTNHIAIVVDEWGGVAGLVTIEDLVEEVVGEVVDEHDRDLPQLNQLDDGSWQVSAHLGLDELGDLFDLEVDDEDVDSVGGLLTKALGRIATVGDQVQTQGLQLQVAEVDSKRQQVCSVLVQALTENNDKTR